MSVDADGLNRELQKNLVSAFLLRIDFLELKQDCVTALCNKLAPQFKNIERRQATNLKVEVNSQGQSSLQQVNSYDVILNSPQELLSLTLSSEGSYILIEAGKYRSNSVYKGIISDIVDVCSEKFPDVLSKRIGLRYINEFSCKGIKDIGKIFSKRTSTVTKGISGQDVTKISRAIAMEEHLVGDGRIRLQYGVPNKFYPSEIVSYDLLLDIDSFIEASIEVNEWSNEISKLNHAAYAVFTECMNAKFIVSIHQDGVDGISSAGMG
ncbi:TIGR04255 family protein [Aeromonas veronii]